MGTLKINLGTIDLSDDERDAIASVIGRTDGRLASAEECRAFIKQHGIDGVNRALGAS